MWTVRGIEPAADIAVHARARGVPTTVELPGAATAARFVAEHGQADPLPGNNVLAHVPDLNDFVSGMKIVLAPGGVITMEFPHLQRLMAENQFDTIYHEHFSYFSFVTVEQVFAAHGITVFDVEELPTHGGSLRIYGSHENDPQAVVGPRAHALRQRELAPSTPASGCSLRPRACIRFCAASPGPACARRCASSASTRCASMRSWPTAACAMAMLWVLNLGDGRHDLLDIAERAKLPFAQVLQASELLREHGLLKSVRSSV